MALVSYSTSLEYEDLCQCILDQVSVNLDGEEYQVVDSHHNRKLKRLLEPMIDHLHLAEEYMRKSFFSLNQSLDCPMVLPQSFNQRDALERVSMDDSNVFYYYMETVYHTREDKYIYLDRRASDILRSIVVSGSSSVRCYLTIKFDDIHIRCYQFDQVDENTSMLTLQIPIVIMFLFSLGLEVVTDDDYCVTYYQTYLSLDVRNKIIDEIDFIDFNILAPRYLSIRNKTDDLCDLLGKKVIYNLLKPIHKQTTPQCELLVLYDVKN